MRSNVIDNAWCHLYRLKKISVCVNPEQRPAKEMINGTTGTLGVDFKAIAESISSKEFMFSQLN
jgi:hypothetical protein